MSEALRQGDVPGVQLRCRRRLAAPLVEVWAWLTEPAKLSLWLARPEPQGASIGKVLELRSPDESGELVCERAETLEIEPPRRWVLAWRRTDEPWPTSTRLTFELDSRDDECELSILQEGFAHLPLSDCLTIWEFYRRRWQTALDRLEKGIEGLGA